MRQGSVGKKGMGSATSGWNVMYSVSSKQGLEQAEKNIKVQKNQQFNKKKLERSSGFGFKNGHL